MNPVKPTYQKISTDPVFPVRAIHMHSEPKRDLIYCHWHPNIEIIHVTKGDVAIQLDNHQVHLTEGDICIINPNIVHFGNPVEAKDTSVHLVVLSYDILPYKTDDYLYQRYIAPLQKGSLLLPDVINNPNKKKDTPSWEKACHHQLLKLIDFGDRPFAGRELAIQGIFLEILSLLYHHNQLIHAREVEDRLLSSRNRAILDYVEANFTSNLSITDIAKHFDINEDYFYRLFKTFTGQTPTVFISQLRIRYAKQLLRNTTLPISEIAFQVGYNSSSYFSKMFHRLVGISPRTYRNNRE